MRATKDVSSQIRKQETKEERTTSISLDICDQTNLFVAMIFNGHQFTVLVDEEVELLVEVVYFLRGISMKDKEGEKLLSSSYCRQL